MFENCKLEDKLEFVEGDTLRILFCLVRKGRAHGCFEYTIKWLFCKAVTYTAGIETVQRKGGAGAHANTNITPP